MDRRLSIIVPVYNVEKYVSRCIESILAQTFSDFELILVNDGSTDNSYRICCEYREKDSRVTVLSQENKGVSSARNFGMSAASGEWIGFVDSDDYIDPDFYETLFSGVAASDANVICCGVKAVDEKGTEHPHLQYNNIPRSPHLLSGREMWEHYLNPSKRYLFWSPWDKIIKSEIAKKHLFEVDRKLGEDFYFCFECLNESGSVYYIPAKKYNYFLRPGSAVRSGKFSKSAFDSVYFAQKAYSILKDDPELKIFAEMNLLIVAARVLRGYYKKNTDGNTYTEIDECREILKNSDKDVMKRMEIRHKLLIYEAAYVPILFKIR